MKKGDRVKYWKGAKRGPPSGEGVIYAEGVMGVADVVWITGCAGCIAVSHVEPVDDPQRIVTADGLTVDRYPPSASPPPSRRPRATPRFELIAKTGLPGDVCLGFESTMISARSRLRHAIRTGSHLDAWIIDHVDGRQYDLAGPRLAPRPL